MTAKIIALPVRERADAGAAALKLLQDYILINRETDPVRRLGLMVAWKLNVVSMAKQQPLHFQGNTLSADLLAMADDLES
ncbi:MAG: hypothetical protein ACR2PX_01180 [Endozoicomonas sp.]|uniref:hypothetical protein n=1 Tax=Endozoicomonas sp. TaxID=1892382 RepID=UPI003D9BDD75